MKSPHTRDILAVLLVVLITGGAFVATNPAGARNDAASVSPVARGSLTGNANQTLNVTEMRAPQNVTIGDNVSVSATIRNPKDSKVRRPVALRFDGDFVSRHRVTVPANGTKNVSFSLDTSNGTAGSHVLSVQTYRFGEVRRIEFSQGGGNATNNTSTSTTFNNTSTSTTFNNTSTSTTFNNTSTSTTFNNTSTSTTFNNTSTSTTFNNTSTSTTFNNTSTSTTFNNTSALQGSRPPALLLLCDGRNG